jgi:magnesium transporter
VIVDCALYVDGHRRPGSLPLEGARAAATAPGSFVWVGLREPSPEEFDLVREEFGLHELAVEDAMTADQRPKLEVYDHTLFIAMKTARYLDQEEEVDFGEIFMFLGSDFIVVVRHGEAAELASVRRSLDSQPELLSRGPAAVLHGIMDRVVDAYGPVVLGLAKDIDEVERDVFSPSTRTPAATSATSTTTPPRPPPSSSSTGTSSPRCSRRTWRRSGYARTRTCGRSPPGWRWRSSPPSSPASTA